MHSKKYRQDKYVWHRKRQQLWLQLASADFVPLPSRMTLVWTGNQGNITAPRSPRLLHCGTTQKGKHPALRITPGWWSHASRGTGSGWLLPLPARSQRTMVSQMVILQLPGHLLHIPDPHDGQPDVWSIDQPHPMGGIAVPRYCSAGLFGIWEKERERKGGKRKISAFPDSCSACKTWQLLSAWLYRDQVWQYRYCKKAQESHASPFTLSIRLASLGAALTFNEIR